MNRQYKQTITQETIIGAEAAPHVTVELNERLSVMMDAAREPAKLTLGTASGDVVYVQMFDPDSGQVGDTAVPDGCIGVVWQPSHRRAGEGYGYRPIFFNDDGTIDDVVVQREEGKSAREGSTAVPEFDFSSTVSREPVHVHVRPEGMLGTIEIFQRRSSTNGVLVEGVEAYSGVLNDALDDTSYVYRSAAPDRQLQLRQEAQQIAQETKHTLAHTVLVLSDAEVAAVTPETVRGSNEENTAVLQRVMANEQYHPVAGITLDSKKFMASVPFSVQESTDLVSCLMICEDTDGTSQSFLLNKDPYDDVWRHSLVRSAASQLGFRRTGDPIEGKAVVKEVSDLLNYVRFSGEYGEPTEVEYREAVSMVTHSDTSQRHDATRRKSDMSKLSGEDLLIAKLDMYDQQETADDDAEQSNGVPVPGAKHLGIYAPGRGFVGLSAEEGRAKIATIELPTGFVPDFADAPQETYKAYHEVLGPYDVEVFGDSELNGQPVQWHIARDPKDDHVWVKRIVPGDGLVTVYGTPEQEIDAGALLMSPIERIAGRHGGNFGVPGIDFQPIDGLSGHGDMKPDIDRNPVVKAYRTGRAERMSRKNERKIRRRRSSVVLAARALAGMVRR